MPRDLGDYPQGPENDLLKSAIRSNDPVIFRPNAVYQHNREDVIPIRISHWESRNRFGGSQLTVILEIK